MGRKKIIFFAMKFSGAEKFSGTIKFSETIKFSGAGFFFRREKKFGYLRRVCLHARALLMFSHGE
jgi:hypothetical protein